VTDEQRGGHRNGGAPGRPDMTPLRRVTFFAGVIGLAAHLVGAQPVPPGPAEVRIVTTAAPTLMTPAGLRDMIVRGADTEEVRVALEIEEERLAYAGADLGASLLALILGPSGNAAPIWAASERDDLGTLELLLDRAEEAGRDEHYSDAGWKLLCAAYAGPLTGAAACGHTEAVRLLIARGAPVNGPFYGRSALEFAAMGGHHGAVRVLLAAGAEHEEVLAKLLAEQATARDVRRVGHALSPAVRAEEARRDRAIRLLRAARGGR